MAVIKLRTGQEATVDEQDVDLLIHHSWDMTPFGYAVRRNRSPYGKRIHTPMHREIMGRTYKDGALVDHINMNRLDNRRVNLHVCTQSQNLMNRGAPSSNTSGFKGVTFHKPNGTWIARITPPRGKMKNLGYYKTPEEAHEVYCLWADMLHGEFANYGV